MGLDSERAMIATAVAGGTDDILPISFLERARRAADAVGHLTQVNGTSMGTCLMVSPRLLMTNNHVIKTPEIAKRRRVHFNFEKDAAGTALPVSSFKLDPETFWLTDPSAELDFTVVALGEPVNAGATQPAFRRLSGRNDKHALGDFVNIIQHPNGHPKRIVLRENMLVHRAGTDPAAEPVLLYTADTDESSSGAPVFNDFWDLVALHHASVKAGNITICGETRLDVVNEGGRASFIIAALNAARHTLSDEQRELLDDALAE
ncbi:MAG TPA: serine protease [Longimicrobium sp.]|nr:serine protease [Longimicrobium sp.]